MFPTTMLCTIRPWCHVGFTYHHDAVFEEDGSDSPVLFTTYSGIRINQGIEPNGPTKCF